MADTIQIYTLDKDTEYEPESIMGENIRLLVESGSTGEKYVKSEESKFNGTYSILYTTFNINLQDISTECVIGEGAFQNHNELTTIEIPNSVVQIGEWAFRGCSGLTSISLPFVGDKKDSKQTFGWIFENEQVQSDEVELTLPEKLTTVNITGDIEVIQDNAFKGAGNLTNINLPNSIKEIGSKAFYGSGVSNLVIPDGVVRLGTDAFKGMNNLLSVTWYTTNFQLEGVNISYSAQEFFDVLEEGNKYKVYGYKYIKNESPETNNYYGTQVLPFIDSDYEYNDETYLVTDTKNNIVVGFAPIVSRLFSPDNVTNLQGYCGKQGDNLQYVLEPIGSTQYKLIIKGYGEMDDYNILQYESDGVTKYRSTAPWGVNDENIIELQLPDNITSIGDYAFYNLSLVTKIIMPQFIEKIGKFAFYKCERAQFSDLRIDNQLNLLRLLHLKTIGESAFEYCKELEEFNCDKGVLEKIDLYAFKNCINLTTVILPDNDIYLEKSIFLNCDNLKTLSIPISSDINKGLKNDFTKFNDNYVKYNIGALFTSFSEKYSVENTNKYIPYNCWLTGYSYSDLGIQTSNMKSGDYVREIAGLYVPKALKYITIRNGIMPQFYLYNGDDEYSCWEKVVLEKNVAQTIYFTYATKEKTQGFTNTKAIVGTSGRLVGVIANKIEIYNITSDTFYNGEGLLGFDRNSLSNDKACININNNYSHSKYYKEIVCRECYEKFIVNNMSIESPIQINQLDLSETSITTLSTDLFSRSMVIDTLYLPPTVTKITGPYRSYNTQKVDSNYPIKKIEGHKDGVISDIERATFSRNSMIEQVNCKMKMNSIPSYLFYGCENLKSVQEIEGYNIVIETEAFYECKNLKSITFVENSTVNTVELLGFKDCFLLSMNNIPWVNQGIEVDDRSFINCTQLKQIKINNFKASDSNVYSCFMGCTNLKSVDFSNNVTEIPKQAFSGCPLENVRIPLGVTSIGEKSFAGYKGSWIELPQLYGNKLSYILGDPVDTLTEVYISNSITVPYGAFDGWNGLTTVYFKLYNGETSVRLSKEEECDDYFDVTVTEGSINWINSELSLINVNFDANTTQSTQSFEFTMKKDGIFYFEWMLKLTDNRNYTGSFSIKINNESIRYMNIYQENTWNEKEQLLVKEGDTVYFEIYFRQGSKATFDINNVFFNKPPQNVVDPQHPQPYPALEDLPWTQNIAGTNKMRFLSPSRELFNNTAINDDDSDNCLYLDYNKKYLWNLLLYGKQHDVYITDNNTYSEQHSYLPCIYVPNHTGIEKGQYIDLQGENTYKIIDTQLFKHTGKIYYRQSQGVITGKISYESVSNGTLYYILENENYEVDDELKKWLSNEYVEFSTGSTYDQSLYKGKIKINDDKIWVKLEDNVSKEEFEFGMQIALKTVVVQRANLKSELLNVVTEGSKFVVGNGNSNQVHTVTNIDEFYRITMTPGLNVNTTGYDEITITLIDEKSRILPNDINNNEIVVVVNTKGKIKINGKLGEEIKKGIIDENLMSLIEINKTSFDLEGTEYIITNLDISNNTIYFQDKNNNGYIINNQVLYEYDIQLKDCKNLITNKGFDITDLHLTLNYINIFEIDSIYKYYIDSEILTGEDFKLEDGEELYLIKCKEIVNPTNYEVAFRNLEKEAVIERYSTILTVETLEGEVPQHLLVSPDTNYYIYSNNIKTPPFYFENIKKQDIKVVCNEKEIENEMTLCGGSALFEAFYEDNIANCTWSLQELYNEDYIEVDKVVNQYSPNLFYNYHLFEDDTNYKLTVTITTEDGLTITKSINIKVNYDTPLEIVNVFVEKDCDKQAIKINLQDIGLKIKELDYQICPRSWLTDENAIYQIDSLYVIRKNLENPEEKAVIAQVKGFPKNIYDYSFQREGKYQYSILPFYYNVNEPFKLMRGKPSVVQSIVQFNLKTIALIGTEMDVRENIQETDLLYNNYQTDSQLFTKWFFKYNTDARSVSIMTDKTVFETITPFATVNYSARNYKTGTATAFLGAYHKDKLTADWTYKDSIRLQNKFQEFANNGKVKMFRDEIGNVIPVDITLKSFEYNSHTIPTNITVSFEWTQIDTEKNFTVFEVEYDEDLEKLRRDNRLPNYPMINNN